MHRWLALVALAACGTTSARPGPDAGGPDAPMRGDDAVLAPPDGPVDSPGVDCFYNWSAMKTCGAPVIVAAYLTIDCAGTSGVFVVGHGFESANQFMMGN